MISSTSSTDINVRTVLLCVCRQPRSVVPRPEVVARGQVLAAAPDYPSTAEIECLTREIIAVMRLAARYSDLNRNQD